MDQDEDVDLSDLLMDQDASILGFYPTNEGEAFLISKRAL